MTNSSGSTNVRPRVLLADDDRDLLDMWRTNMRDAPFAVDFAAGGLQALVMYREAKGEGWPYSLIVLDQLMPGMLGTTVAREIREGGDSGVRLWLLTGSRDGDILREADTFDISQVMLKGGRRQTRLKEAIAAELGLMAVAA